MKYQGKLHPKEWFLKNGWKGEENQIIELNEGFTITYDELDSILILSEVSNYKHKELELQDENGTQYKKEWFKKIKEIK